MNQSIKTITKNVYHNYKHQFQHPAEHLTFIFIQNYLIFLKFQILIKHQHFHGGALLEKLKKPKLDDFVVFEAKSWSILTILTSRY